MLLIRDYSLIWALTFTIFALFAKFKVERVSWKQWTELDIVPIIKVFEFPPKESLSKFVSFESLYGMWFLCFYEVRALITIPNVVSDLFMLLASFNLSPVVAVNFCLSDPAKSIKWSFGVFKIFFPSTYILKEMDIVKIECDREDSLFIIVSPICRFLNPRAKH